ncbi:MAG: GntR family transcriptional regulator [Candidatus Omnitrophota bacterium]
MSQENFVSAATICFESSEPLYLQIARSLEQNIRKRKFKPFEKLPHERALANLYNVNRDTVRKANRHLEKAGVLIRVQGKGTFVTDITKVGKGRRRIGIITDRPNDSTDDFIPNVFKGIWSALAGKENRYKIEFFTAEDYVAHQDELEGNIDGLLFFVLEANEEFILTLKKKKIPLIMVNYYIPGVKLNCVLCNHEKATLEATEYLLKLGHKNIAFLCGNFTYQSDIKRLEGYKMALKKHDVIFTPNLVKRCGYMKNETERCVDEFLSLPERPSAIICADDRVAYWVARILRQYHLSVPDDISLMGFNDMKIASTMHPPLTTMRMPMEEIGKLATEMLLEIIGGGKLPKKESELNFTLVERRSCKKNVE